MNKFQNVNFASVEDFLDYLPDNELIIVDLLRKLVFENIPNCIEKLAYNVPFYYRNSRICFIWPSTVPWGKVEKDGVQLGFCYGNLINDHFNWFDKASRKQVYIKTFFSADEIDIEMIKYYLFEAVELDKQFRKPK